MTVGHGLASIYARSNRFSLHCESLESVEFMEPQSRSLTPHHDRSHSPISDELKVRLHELPSAEDVEKLVVSLIRLRPLAVLEDAPHLHPTRLGGQRFMYSRPWRKGCISLSHSESPVLFEVLSIQ
jgi:hypothetical protein